ncbi:family 16 glycosylhydrolase [Paenarthrobacter sp. GOM3]|uniref:glycoside hydrolase family 16 protein n=1 Tax=Paenarthrobacter sp. GOM3 TaxID=2782567 RepID=UPI001BA7F568|nr:glycoside hydrolase family 16 protein [Paenarthrobacter sp. GOM3]WOH19406.1 family 16 glycosylhydrolase [Paenarthrobacter sp. GOM3]
MKRRLTPWVMVIVGFTLIATLIAPEPPALAAAGMPAPGALVWSDEFNGLAGSAPDNSKWLHDTGGSGWGNGELQYYTSSTRNAAMDGHGNMAITARRENPDNYSCHYGTCQYTSARLLTAGKFSRNQGRFEARLKLPKGQGMWPAFWMLGDNVFTDGWPNSGELDVMENVGKEPGTIWGSIHGPGYSGANSVNASYTLPNGKVLGDAFHTFTVDWGPESITWYIDGIPYSHKTKASVSGPWVFDHNFFLLLNLAVGGNWPGAPDPGTVLPQSLLVDYVRVYELAAAPSPPAAAASVRIQGYAGKCIDIAGRQAIDGSQLQLWDCDTAASEQWTFAGNGTVRALGKCMDVAWGSTSNGARIQLTTCNGSAAQQFVLNSAGDLVNPQANKCVDVADWSSANGARLQLWDCAGSANQKWWRTV